MTVPTAVLAAATRPVAYGVTDPVRLCLIALCVLALLACALGAFACWGVALSYRRPTQSLFSPWLWIELPVPGRRWALRGFACWAGAVVCGLVEIWVAMG